MTTVKMEGEREERTSPFSQEDINSDSLNETITDSEEEEEEDSEEESFYSYTASTSVRTSTVPSLVQETHKPLTKQELRDFYKLSSQISQHNENLQNKKDQLERKVEELRQCREDIRQLKRNYTQLDDDLKTKLKGNKVSSQLTELELQKIHKEIEMKQSIEKNYEEEVTQFEIALLEAELSCAQFDSSQPLYEEQRTQLQQQKHKQGLLRIQTQTREVIEAQRKDKMEEEKELKKESEKNKIKKEYETMKTQSQYLQEKTARLKEQEIAKEESQRKYREKRIQALLSLKKNIDSNRSALRAYHLQIKEKEKRIGREENEEREKALAEGRDPDVAVLKKRKLEQLEKEKQAFEEKQKRKQMDIVSRLLEEAKRQEKELKKKQSFTSFNEKKRRRKSKNVIESEDTDVHIDDTHDDNTIIDEQKNDEEERREEEEGRMVEVIKKGEEEKDEVTLQDKTLLQPNIPGLWEPVEEIPQVVPKRTKMEQAIMDKTLQKLKDSIVRPQIAGGKEFKGQTAFLSKPREIIFKDFSVGETYKKRLQLTNVSYTINHLKLIGASENLKDFIHIEFNPPGPMSAGLTCPLVVTFEPKVNDDIVGSVDFLSQTGPFSITVKCLIKKCVVSVDASNISFGTVCIGEEIKQSFTVYNKGALSTGFLLQPLLPVAQHIKSSSTNDSEEDRVQSHSLLTESQRSILSTVEYTSEQKASLLLPQLELRSHSITDISGLTRSSAKVQFKDKTPTPVQLEIERKLSGNKEEGPSLEKETEKGEKEEEKGKEKGKEKSISDKRKEKEEEREEEKEKEESDNNEDTHEEHDNSIEGDEAPPSTPPPQAITIGEVMGGELSPYSSIELSLSFTPTVPGNYETQFILNTSTEPVYITATGQGIDVPIHTDRELIDLKVCMIDRLYQDSITLHNRSRTALQATFSIPPPLSPHMEILPKYGIVQGESSFSAQLKFLPLSDILLNGEKEGGGERGGGGGGGGGGERGGGEGGEEKERGLTDYIGKDGVMTVPVSILVAGQTNPVIFTVTAIVTESELSLSQTQLEFGYCTIEESVVTNIELTNKSCLPQDYGFVHLPKWLSVQPNDGFGTLLPHETISVDVIFTPDKPQQYFTDTILCMTSINKQYKLSATGTSVQSPLTLTHSSVQFAATPINTTTVSRVTISNPCLSRSNSAVIRGLAPTKGPRLFEFCVPGGLPVSVSPRVGVVKPGESLSVEVSFSPTLDPQDITDASIRLARVEAEIAAAAKRAEEERLAAAREEEKPTKGAKGGKKGGGGGGRASKASSNKTNSLASDSIVSANATVNSTQQDNEEINKAIQDPTPTESLWWEAYNQLLTEYNDHQYRSLIPCYISAPLTNGEQHTTDYRSEEMIYLDITATAIRPSLVIVSDKGQSTIDFGSTAIGSSVRKSVQLKNISLETLKLTASHIREEFELRNALRTLLPGSCHTLLLQFAPQSCGKYHETLHIKYASSKYIELTLCGEGVNPFITVTPTDTSCIDWGHVMTGDVTTQSICMSNPSEVSVAFELSTVRCARTGVANYNGQPLFTCIPHNGLIQSESNVDVAIQFSPDRPDCTFIETLDITVNNKQISSMELRGSSICSNMYALGGERIGSERKLMAATPDDIPPNNSSTDTPSSIHSLPLLYMFLQKDDSKPIQKQLMIGCIKSSLVKKPKGEYVIETLQGTATDVKCFTIEPMKGVLDPGEVKNVNITFNPPKDTTKVTGPIKAHTNVILKGDTTVQYQLVLQTM